MNIRLSKEQKIKILNTDDVYTVMQAVLLRQNKIRRNQEHFWVIGLDNKNAILFLELVAIGRDNRVKVHPPDVFRIAIYKLSSKIILVHNHPSGNLIPSAADLDFTDRLIKTGQILDIEVLDHFIISDKGFTSLAETGDLERLKKSGNYQVTSPEKKLLYEYKLKEERERGEKDAQKEFVLRLHAMGHDTDFINKATGLHPAEILKIIHLKV